ncbi:MAG: energy transducer TonB [candidate division Zixibacteria bacterium]|nr:energy transducer TonB [candidate division Zixibacteria bacterium]MDD5426048.1 energy transducer TonB [candidate division Zixibacteria bacterium]
MRYLFKSLFFTFALVITIILLSERGVAQDANKDLPDEKEFIAVEILPEMIYEETPLYPEIAKEKKLEGTVYIKALIDKSGTVIDAKVLKTCGTELLDKAALAAAHKCKYKPAVQKGKPVATWVTYKVEFKLDKDQEKPEKQ